MKTDLFVELKALRVHGMAGAVAELVEKGVARAAVSATFPRAG